MTEALGLFRSEAAQEADGEEAVTSNAVTTQGGTTGGVTETATNGETDDSGNKDDT